MRRTFDWDRGARPFHVTNAASEGIKFFTHKITEGTRTVHRHAGEMLKAAVAAKIPFVGLYVVPRTPGNNGNGSVAAQVDFAIAEANRQFPEWKTTKGFFWQVDLEHWSDQDGPYDNVAPVHGNEMCRLLESKTGKKTLLYAPKWAYGDSITGSYPLWASSYRDNPAVRFTTAYERAGGDSHPGWAAYSGRVPKILQFGSRCVIGSQHTCDGNAFRGTEADFAAMIGVPVTPTPTPETPVTYTPVKWKRQSIQTGPLGERMIAFLERYYPQGAKDALYFTSAYRPTESGSHHSGLSYGGSPTAAVDIGAYDDPADSLAQDQLDMRALSLWIIKYFGDLTVELIHTHPTDAHYTYIRHQVRVAPYASDDHINHVHWATSDLLLRMCEARARKLWPHLAPGVVVTPAPTPAVPPFPLPAGHYYGLLSGPAESHGGYYVSERDEITAIQKKLIAKGHAPNVSGWADGLFEQATYDAVVKFQRASGLGVDGRVGPVTWKKLFS